ncbi:MAG: DUF4347 domain-containing protein, partial [Magnetococcales bacterium]|nr:DUF4347 domain-containing protein [Magnetococcales bacterium]
MKFWPWIRDLFSKQPTQDEPNRKPAQIPQTRPWRSRLALRLERRLMFDAAGVLTALAALHHDSHGADGHDATHDGDHSAFPPPEPEAPPASPRSMIFIDSTVDHYQTLLHDLPTDAQVVLLNPNLDGVEQIRTALAGHAGIEAVHIVSHGSPGYLALGNSELDVVNLEDHANTLQEWGNSLSENADILIYGCDVGAGMTGGAFVSRLSQLTGADVAASNDLTGAAERGGNWTLETVNGVIDTQVFPSEAARLEFHGILPSANPVISNLNGDTLAYSEGSGALVIDQGGNVTVSDPDSADFNGGTLTVAITVNRDATEDLLAIRNQGTGVGQIGVAGANVTYEGTVIGTFAGGSGTNNLLVSLNANANTTSVSALLKNITYANSDTINPTTSPRTITFGLTDGDGGTSVTASTSAAVSRVNDAPTIAGGATLNYTENNAATVIDPTITLADVDDTNLESAVITINANYQSGADQLVFTNTANITGAWNAASGILTLTGTDTIANYQAALRSVKYQNTSDAPTTTARTISFQVNDGSANSTTSTASVNITAVNDAPVLSGTQLFAPPILRSETTNTGATIGSLFVATDITDPDPTPLEGVAIYARSNNGVGNWQYRVNGGAWINLPGGLNSANALLLKASDEIRFVPDNTDGGQPTLSFYAWDQTSGVAGTQVNANTRGTTTAFSTASGTINGTVNAAPVLDISGSPILPTITEDQLTNTGQTVSALLGASQTDIDSGAQQGIAIRSVTTDNGTWQYSTNGGTSWSNFGTISSTQSLLLRPTDRVRFVPDGANPPNDLAPGSLNFTFVSWDRTGRSSTWTAGGKVSTISRGSSTPFSANIETVGITVTDLNDAPVLAAANPALPDIMYTETTNAGVSVSTLVGSSISDVDAVTTPLEGIAIHTLNNGTGGGYWEYSTDNGTNWTSAGTVSTVQALLLRPQDKIRFQPGTLNFTDNASFGFYAWDQTQNLGQQGTKTNVTTRGTTTAFSTAGDTATIHINVAPTLDPSANPTLPTITEDDTTNAGATVSTLLGTANDIDVGAAQGIALYGLNSGNGTWQYNTGSGWTNVGTVNQTSALLLRSTDSIRFVPNAIKGTTPDISFYAWDQTTGTFGTKVDVSTRGTTTAFSVTGDTASISVTEVNDVPTLTVTATTLTVSEGSAPTAINNTLTLADIDDLNLAGATVRITSNLVSSEDLLSFVNQSGIVGSWNGATGTLTLTGTATKAQYQTALRSITYQNTNGDNPNTATRTVTFTITDGNSDATGFGALTATGARPIAITPINDAPTLSTTGTALSVTEGDGPTLLDNGLTLADVDDTQLTAATIQITSNYRSGEDVLVFANQAGITGSWNAALGKLTLTGAATRSDYQTALRSITYQNVNTANPDINTRTVTFTITDANSGGAGSGSLTASATRSITPIAVNDAPTATANATALNYSENDGAVSVDPSITLTDVDDTNIAGVSIQIVGNYRSNQDQLAFVNLPGITGAWNGLTGTLTLSGTASKADYQTALRSITYQNSSDDPDTNTRTIRFTITDTNSNGQGSGAQSVSIQRDIHLTPINDAPTLTGSVLPLSYTESSAATPVDTALSLADVDDTLINGATVQITGHYLSSEDMLAFTNQSGITGSWNATTGLLTLSGQASKADYQTALRSITYQNTNNDNPSVTMRTVTFSVTDSNSNGTGSGALTHSASRNIIMTAINDAPNMTTHTPLAYSEGETAKAVDTGLSLSDVDDDTIVGGMVQITGNYLASEDSLTFINQSGITGIWNPATGTLVLSGTTTKANYETALRTITYHNTNTDSPSTATRTITFSVTDGNSNGVGDGAITTQASRSIVVSAINDAPGVSTSAAPLAYTESDAATPVDASLSLSDVDDAFISGATVQITGHYLSGEDVLSFVDQSGISGSWNATT